MKNSTPVLLSFLIFTCFSCAQEKDIRSFEAMNTFMVLKSYGRKSVRSNILAQARIFELEDCISVTKKESDIFKVNNANGAEIVLQEDAFCPLQFALNMAGESEGLFNPLLYPVIREWGFTTGVYKVPESSVISALMQNTDYTTVVLDKKKKSVKIRPDMMIDLGAVGKGYAGDCAIQLLRANGIKSAILDLGGNVQTIGKKPDGSLWSVGIKNPWGEGSVAGLKISDKAVITSGGYERFFEQDGKRYIHIFDGKTGYPVENEISSVTIVCKSGLLGDSLSTTLFVMGVEKAIDFWQNRRDFDMLILTNDQTLFYTKTLETSLSILYQFNDIHVVE